MGDNKIIQKLLGGWKYTLVNRYELLHALKDRDLDFIPPKQSKLIDMQFQFATLGGSYRAYIKLMKEKHYTQGIFLPLEIELKKFRTINSIETELKKIDKEFEKEALKHTDDEQFDWGHNIITPLWRTIISVQEMERLCHGQIICYFALAGLKLPPNFKRDWGFEYLN